MIVACYSRKSTEQNVTDDARSVTRQVDLAKQFATRRGWVVAEEHVYIDDAVSGAEWVERDGLNRLLAAVRTTPPPFDAIVMMAVDRLGREQYRLASTLLEIVESGVRVFFYTDGAELKLDTPIAKITLSLQGFAAEDYRHQIRVKTREALRARAKAGWVTGGKVYGYQNVRENGHVRRVINEPEAQAIRRIFEEITQGRGFHKIARGFNQEGVPAPRANRHWAMSGVREMVYRRLYRGEIIYGKTRWVDRGGTKKKVRVPESDRLTIDAPALRIVPEELWQAAHARLDRTRQTYLRQTGGKLYGRPESGIEARHLLSGFLVCGSCGGAMHAIRWASRRKGSRVTFTCHNWRANGACENNRTIPLPTIDQVVIEALRAILSPDFVRDVIVRVRELAEEPEALDQRRQLYTDENARLRSEIERLTDAIASGGGSIPSVLDALKARERRRTEVTAQLEHLDGLTKTEPLRPGAPLAREIQARLNDWHGLLGRQPQPARQIVRRLIKGKLTLTPKDEGYEWRGEATYGALLSGLVGFGPPSGPACYDERQ